MARVTVEDCVLKVPNRFELVMLAGHRARAISAGEQLTVDRDNDKNPVVALREIADETVMLEHIEESLIRSLQVNVEFEDSEDEDPFCGPAVSSVRLLMLCSAVVLLLS